MVAVNRPVSVLMAAAFSTAWATPGIAQAPGTCQRWSFAHVDDEGGKAPRAFVCPLGSNGGSFYAGCDGRDLVWFALHAGAGAPTSDPDFKGRFIIDIGDDTFRRPALFQALDDSLVIPAQGVGGPFFAAMLAGAEISIRLEAVSNSGDSFTLAGSTAALKSLAAACAKSGG